MDIRLALETGVDIPIPEIQYTIHQPNMKEISQIGTQDFLLGIQTLSISKSLLAQGNSVLENTTNFQIFMTIMQEKETQDKKAAVLALMQLIFPGVSVMFTPQSILLSGEGQSVMVDENNFEALQGYIKEIFCINSGRMDQQTFNPADARAKEIAEKLMRGRQRVAEQKGDAEGDPFGRYISILAIALKVSPLEVSQLTMYQLYDLMERYSLWLNWDLDIRSRLAGGKPDGKPEDWMKNIH